MTTLLRRLAQRAVRAAAPVPVPVPEGLEVIDEEQTVDASPAGEPLHGAPDTSGHAAAPPPPGAPVVASPTPRDVRGLKRDAGEPVASTPVREAPVVAATPWVPAVAASEPVVLTHRESAPADESSAATTVAAIASPDSTVEFVLAAPVSVPVWPVVVPAHRARGDAAGEQVHDGGPTVQVRIGRLDVRAVPPAPAPTAPRHAPSQDRTSELALSDYLRGKRTPR